MPFRKLVVFIMLPVLFSCKEDNTDYESLAASEAAKEYYSTLKEGKCDKFIDGFVRIKSYPEECRSEFRKNAEDFMNVQKDRHGGIISVEVSSTERDSINKTINVFLSLSYGDSTKTRVLVPMVKDNDKWLMK